MAAETPEACAICGMDDLPLVGPDVQRLCPYCDALRILPGLPPEAQRQSSLPARRNEAALRAATVLAMLVSIVAGALVPELQWMPAGVLLCVAVALSFPAP